MKNQIISKLKFKFQKVVLFLTIIHFLSKIRKIKRKLSFNMKLHKKNWKELNILKKNYKKE